MQRVLVDHDHSRLILSDKVAIVNLKPEVANAGIVCCQGFGSLRILRDPIVGPGRLLMFAWYGVIRFCWA